VGGEGKDHLQAHESSGRSPRVGEALVSSFWGWLFFEVAGLGLAGSRFLTGWNSCSCRRSHLCSCSQDGMTIYTSAWRALSDRGRLESIFTPGAIVFGSGGPCNFLLGLFFEAPGLIRVSQARDGDGVLCCDIPPRRHRSGELVCWENPE
jgi:hypothetical protein